MYFSKYKMRDYRKKGKKNSFSLQILKVTTEQDETGSCNHTV